MVSFKDPRSTGPRRLETWIVLELCGLGSLQVRRTSAGRLSPGMTADRARDNSPDTLNVEAILEWP